MFNFKIEKTGDKVEIEVWHGEVKIASHELPMRDMRDRVAIMSAFNSADSVLRREVLEWIQKHTPLTP